MSKTSRNPAIDHWITFLQTANQTNGKVIAFQVESGGGNWSADAKLALTVPVIVEYMRGGGDPDWNWFREGLVRRTLTAVDDLQCEELL